MVNFSHVALALCVGSVGMAVLNWRWRARERRRRALLKVNDPSYETFPLLPMEVGLCRSFAVSTMTFFTGDSAEAEGWFKLRVLEIMRANPWLAGRLVTCGEDARLCVCHPKQLSEADVDSYIAVLHNPSLHPSMSYVDMVSQCTSLLIKRGMDCVDRDEEQLFRLLFVRVSAQSFAVVLSLSHVLGDGSTYYRLYSMLSCKTAVAAMTVQRRMEFFQVCQELVRLPELVNSALFKLRSVSFALLPKSARRRTFIAELDPSWLAAQKQKYAGAGGQFVSSNDVLVSWFVRSLGLDFCIMAFDARKRIPSLTDIDASFAGNYITPLLFLGQDARSPLQVRQSLAYKCREAAPLGQAGFRSESDLLPTPAQQLRYHCGMCTNWATFYADIELPSACSVQHHTPIVQMSVARFPNVMIIFRPRTNALALLLTTTCPALQACVLGGGEGCFLADRVTEVTSDY